MPSSVSLIQGVNFLTTTFGLAFVFFFSVLLELGFLFFFPLSRRVRETLHDLFCLYFSKQAEFKSQGTLGTLIEVSMHLIILIIS